MTEPQLQRPCANKHGWMCECVRVESRGNIAMSAEIEGYVCPQKCAHIARGTLSGLYSSHICLEEHGCIPGLAKLFEQTRSVLVPSSPEPSLHLSF